MVNGGRPAAQVLRAGTPVPTAKYTRLVAPQRRWDMKGYEDSRYYSWANKIVDKWNSGNLTVQERDTFLLQALGTELAHPEVYGTWLVNHFNSTAEFLLENSPWISEYCTDGQTLEQFKKTALNETAIFRHFGYNLQADMMQEMFDEALASIGEDG